MPDVPPSSRAGASTRDLAPRGGGGAARCLHQPTRPRRVRACGFAAVQRRRAPRRLIDLAHGTERRYRQKLALGRQLSVRRLPAMLFQQRQRLGGVRRQCGTGPSMSAASRSKNSPLMSRGHGGDAGCRACLTGAGRSAGGARVRFGRAPRGPLRRGRKQRMLDAHRWQNLSRGTFYPVGSPPKSHGCTQHRYGEQQAGADRHGPRSACPETAPRTERRLRAVAGARASNSTAASSRANSLSVGSRGRRAPRSNLAAPSGPPEGSSLHRPGSPVSRPCSSHLSTRSYPSAH